MQKQIDDTAGRLGTTMRNARRMCYMHHEDLAALLNVMPNELLEYERGVTKIPGDILERIFVMGYKMIRVRALESRYRRQRIVFRKLKDTIANAE